MIRIIISAQAETDLDSIAAYIAEDNPVRAVTFIHEVRAKFLDIVQSVRKALRNDRIGARTSGQR